MFLSRITSELKIPVLGLVDSDPYGLKILSVYMSGSKNMSYDSASLTLQTSSGLACVRRTWTSTTFPTSAVWT